MKNQEDKAAAHRYLKLWRSGPRLCLGFCSICVLFLIIQISVAYAQGPMLHPDYFLTIASAGLLSGIAGVTIGIVRIAKGTEERWSKLIISLNAVAMFLLLPVVLFISSLRSWIDGLF